MPNPATLSTIIIIPASRTPSMTAIIVDLKSMSRTLAASILDMDFKSTIIAVMLGVLLAGIIMMVLSVAGFGMFLK